MLDFAADTDCQMDGTFSVAARAEEAEQLEDRNLSSRQKTTLFLQRIASMRWIQSNATVNHSIHSISLSR